MLKLEADEIFSHFKSKKYERYDEEKHCKLLIRIMSNPYEGTIYSFCVQAMISERTFYKWIDRYDLFCEIYYFMRMVSRDIWEKEGRAFLDKEYQMGTVNYDFEYWKMVGWSRFGVSRTSKIKIKVNENDSPLNLYTRIIKQASEGEFTASEFKQLMEAVNVGLNVHQIFNQQQQIDEIKKDLSRMVANQENANNNFANKGTSQADQHTL